MGATTDSTKQNQEIDGKGRCAFAAPGRVVGVRNKPEGEKRICQGAKRTD